MKATRRDIMALVGALISASASSKIAQAQQIRAPASAADVPGMPPGTIMTKNYVTMVARTAYVWGWPLVNNLNRALAVKDLPEPGLIGGVVPASPPGYISMLTDYIEFGGALCNLSQPGHGLRRWISAAR